jgi:hypothetical protein
VAAAMLLALDRSMRRVEAQRAKVLPARIQPQT